MRFLSSRGEDGRNLLGGLARHERVLGNSVPHLLNDTKVFERSRTNFFLTRIIPYCIFRMRFLNGNEIVRSERRRVDGDAFLKGKDQRKKMKGGQQNGR